MLDVTDFKQYAVLLVRFGHQFLDQLAIGIDSIPQAFYSHVLLSGRISLQLRAVHRQAVQIQHAGFHRHMKDLLRRTLERVLVVFRKLDSVV